MRPSLAARLRFRARTGLLLALYAGFILIFFAISTNQEYYTWPDVSSAADAHCRIAWRSIEEAPEPRGITPPESMPDWLDRRARVFAMVIGIARRARCSARACGQSRHLPFVADIGTLLAHRGVGDYALATSHFFDLTGPSFAALRLPAILAALAFLLGPTRRLASAPSRTRLRSHRLRRLHRGGLPHRCAHCPGALRTDALLARHC